MNEAADIRRALDALVHRVVASYEFFTQGLDSLWIGALTEYDQFAPNTVRALQIRTDSHLQRHLSPMSNLIENVALAASQEAGDIPEGSSMVDDVTAYLKERVMSQMRVDAQTMMSNYRNFEIRITIAKNQGWNVQHAIVSERERAIQPRSQTKLDAIGRRRMSAGYVFCEANAAMYGIQRIGAGMSLYTTGAEDCVIDTGGEESTVSVHELAGLHPRSTAVVLLKQSA